MLNWFELYREVGVPYKENIMEILWLIYIVDSGTKKQEKQETAGGGKNL